MSADVAAILALNARHETETSPLSEAKLRHMLGQAFHVGLRDAGREAFLIAFDQDADYDSANFRWFAARYPRFCYVDRIVVAAEARGRGHARALYEELFAAAQAASHALVAAEVNLVPPNPVSDAFHDRLGFQEVGRASTPAGDKTVRYLVRSLASAPAWRA